MQWMNNTYVGGLEDLSGHFELPGEATLDIEGGGIGVIFALLVSLTPAVLLFFLTYKTFFKDPVTVEDMLAKKADFLSSLSPASSKSSGFCSYCDEEIELGDRFCPSCGRGRT